MTFTTSQIKRADPTVHGTTRKSALMKCTSPKRYRSHFGSRYYRVACYAQSLFSLFGGFCQMRKTKCKKRGRTVTNIRSVSATALTLPPPTTAKGVNLEGCCNRVNARWGSPGIADWTSLLQFLPNELEEVTMLG